MATQIQISNVAKAQTPHLVNLLIADQDLDVHVGVCALQVDAADEVHRQHALQFQIP